MANPTFTPRKLEPFNGGNLLQGLFQYQANLVDQYIERGKLPPLEVNWNDRGYQAFLKKTISNLLEEMAETSIEVDEVTNIMSGSLYIEEEGRLLIVKYAKLAGLEYVDALHFFIELFMYSGISSDDITLYYKELGNLSGLSGLASDDGFNSAFAFARHNNIHEDSIREFTYYAYTVPGISPDSLDTPLRKVHPDLLKAIDRLFWKVSKTLLRAQNTLKLREWRSTEQAILSVQSYQNMLMEAFTTFIQIADALSMSQQMTYKLFEEKNFINQQRIVDGY